MFVMMRIVNGRSGWHVRVELINWLNSKYDSVLACAFVPFARRLRVPSEKVSLADIEDEVPVSVFVNLPQLVDKDV